MDANIRAGIVTGLSGINPAGGIHSAQTMETPGTPYVVFFVFANNSYRDTVDEFEEYFVQFSTFDKDINPIAAEVIANSIYDALNGATLTFTNYWCSSCLGVRRPFIVSGGEAYWNVVCEIRLRLQKK